MTGASTSVRSRRSRPAPDGGLSYRLPRNPKLPCSSKLPCTSSSGTSSSGRFERSSSPTFPGSSRKSRRLFARRRRRSIRRRALSSPPPRMPRSARELSVGCGSGASGESSRACSRSAGGPTTTCRDWLMSSACVAPSTVISSQHVAEETSFSSADASRLTLSSADASHADRARELRLVGPLIVRRERHVHSVRRGRAHDGTWLLQRFPGRGVPAIAIILLLVRDAFVPTRRSRGWVAVLLALGEVNAGAPVEHYRGVRVEGVVRNAASRGGVHGCASEIGTKREVLRKSPRDAIHHHGHRAVRRAELAAGGHAALGRWKEPRLRGEKRESVHNRDRPRASRLWFPQAFFWHIS